MKKILTIITMLGIMTTVGCASFDFAKQSLFKQIQDFTISTNNALYKFDVGDYDGFKKDWNDIYKKWNFVIYPLIKNYEKIFGLPGLDYLSFLESFTVFINNELYNFNQIVTGDVSAPLLQITYDIRYFFVDFTYQFAIDLNSKELFDNVALKVSGKNQSPLPSFDPPSNVIINKVAYNDVAYCLAPNFYQEGPQNAEDTLISYPSSFDSEDHHRVANRTFPDFEPNGTLTAEDVKQKYYSKLKDDIQTIVKVGLKVWLE